MTAWLLLAVLFILSARCFLWGLTRRERLYQFPTIFGAAWLFYIFPQALGSINNQNKFPPAVLADGGLEIALLMCIACLYAGWRGYFFSLKRSVPSSQAQAYSPRIIFRGGVVLYAVGMYGNFQLAKLAGGFSSQFTGGGHYALEWTGLAVRYVFFGQLVYPGLLLTCLAFARAPSVLRGLTVAVMLVYPLATVIFLGRREAFAAMALILLLSLFYGKKWTPPRATVLAGIAGMAVFVVVAPQYRTITQFGFDFEQVREISVESSLASLIRGEDYAEFDALVVMAAATQRTGDFGLGAGALNSTIAQLVPRQLVGDAAKRALMIRTSTADATSVYGWTIPYGSNPTGIANAFTEFWFFGAFIYFLLGMGMRSLWRRSLARENHGAQVWYAVLASLVPVAVISSLLILPGRLLITALFLVPLLRVARIRARR